MDKATKGLKINVEATGRGEVAEPISEWPEVSDLKLSETENNELSLDVLKKAKAVRVLVNGVLSPAINLDDENAVLINQAGSQLSPEFSKNGENKATDVSFYPNPWAKRKAAEHNRYKGGF